MMETFIKERSDLWQEDIHDIWNCPNKQIQKDFSAQHLDLAKLEHNRIAFGVLFRGKVPQSYILRFVCNFIWSFTILATKLSHLEFPSIYKSLSYFWTCPNIGQVGQVQKYDTHLSKYCQNISDHILSWYLVQHGVDTRGEMSDRGKVKGEIEVSRHLITPLLHLKTAQSKSPQSPRKLLTSLQALKLR